MYTMIKLPFKGEVSSNVRKGESKSVSLVRSERLGVPLPIAEAVVDGGGRVVRALCSETLGAF